MKILSKGLKMKQKQQFELIANAMTRKYCFYVSPDQLVELQQAIPDYKYKIFAFQLGDTTILAHLEPDGNISFKKVTWGV